MVLDLIKPENTCCEIFERLQKHSWKSVHSVKRVHNNDVFVNVGNTNKEEILSGFKTTLCDVLSTI